MRAKTGSGDDSSAAEEERLRFVLLLFAGGEGRRRPWPDARDAFAKGRVVVERRGEPLTAADVATTVRRDGWDVILGDGPHGAVHLALDAWCVVTASDLASVIEVVSGMPSVINGAAVEIRPAR